VAQVGRASLVHWDDLADFVKVPRPKGYVHPFATDEPYASRVYDDAAGVEHLSFVIARMPPGSSGTHHRHVEAEEVHYVMHGRCVMAIGDEHVELRQHDAVRVPPEVRRSMHNPGPDDCWMLVIGAPLTEFTEEMLPAYFAANELDDEPA
jgi:mannose-6-phosphate isomerase-like protein (cupin superfamily)